MTQAPMYDPTFMVDPAQQANMNLWLRRKEQFNRISNRTLINASRDISRPIPPMGQQPAGPGGPGQAESDLDVAAKQVKFAGELEGGMAAVPAALAAIHRDRTGGFPGMISRMTPSQRIEIESLGVRQKQTDFGKIMTQEISRVDQALADPNQHAALAAMLGWGAITAIPDPSRTGVSGVGGPTERPLTHYEVTIPGQWNRATGRPDPDRKMVMTEDQLRTAITAQVQGQVHQYLGSIDNATYALQKTAPQFPALAQKGTYDPVRHVILYPDGTFRQLPVTNADYIRARRLQGKGPFDIEIRQVGNELHAIKMDPQTGTTTSEPLVSGPSTKQIKTFKGPDGLRVYLFDPKESDPAKALTPVELKELPAVTDVQPADRVIHKTEGFMKGVYGVSELYIPAGGTEPLPRFTPFDPGFVSDKEAKMLSAAEREARTGAAHGAKMNAPDLDYKPEVDALGRATGKYLQIIQPRKNGMPDGLPYIVKVQDSPPAAPAPAPATPAPAAVSTPASAPAAESQEGQTATNPTTGERVVFKDGKWQPLQ